MANRGIMSKVAGDHVGDCDEMYAAGEA
jgi:hypothetical protein